MSNNNLNSVFVPYDLPIEDIETLGNYQPSELFGEIKCLNIPPYSLTVDKNKVPEINLEAPDKDKLFYMDFKYMNNKITLNNFLNNGGQIQIRLMPEIQYIFGINAFYVCGSLESAKEMIHELYTSESQLQVKLHNFDFNIDKFITNIFFRWHGIEYKPCFDYKQFCKTIHCDCNDKTYYLKAKDKVYGNW